MFHVSVRVPVASVGIPLRRCREVAPPTTVRRAAAPPPLDAPPFLIGAAAEVRVPEARSISIRRLHEVVHVHHPREARPVPMLKVQGADLVGEAPRVCYHKLVAGVGPRYSFFVQLSLIHISEPTRP